jgi:DNA-directed RNA polymerase specialized sigma24 family protein
MPVLRAAVRVQWPEARQIAVASLGDDSLAPELMEEAIRQTTEHLEALGPSEAARAEGLLAQHYRNAVRRKSRNEGKFSYRGTASDIELLADPIPPSVQAVEAGIDLRSLLRETPPDLRRAMLLRYGARSRWAEVASETTKSKNAIRMSCEREISRIRKKLGIDRKAT